MILIKIGDGYSKNANFVLTTIFFLADSDFETKPKDSYWLATPDAEQKIMS
jgi:hypothetical protein